MRRARTGPSARKKESIGAGTKEPLNLFVRIDSPGSTIVAEKKGARPDGDETKKPFLLFRVSLGLTWPSESSRNEI